MVGHWSYTLSPIAGGFYDGLKMALDWLPPFVGNFIFPVLGLWVAMMLLDAIVRRVAVWL